MEPAAQAAWRAGELAAVKLPYLGIACVVLLWALLVAVAKFPPMAQRVAEDDDVPAGGFRGLRAVSALLARRVRAVRLRRRAGRRVELPDPLHAVQFPGHRRKRCAADNLFITLVLFFAGRFIGTLLMSKFRPATLLAAFAAADVALCVIAALVRRRHRAVRADGHELLHVHPVPDHLHHEPARTGHVHQVRLVVPGHGHRRRRGDSARHGLRLRRQHASTSRCSCRRCASRSCSWFAWKSRRARRRRTPHERGARAPRARHARASKSCTLGFGGAAIGNLYRELRRRRRRRCGARVVRRRACATSTPRLSTASD